VSALHRIGTARMAQESFDRIRQYIVENPAKWECDPENPTATIVEANDPWKSDER
jgi:hypothetical protein